MKTRCKFQVQSVKQFNWLVSQDPVKFGEEIELAAVCDDKKDPENASFASATPSGRLVITVSNPAAVGAFTPGTYYYLDLIPAK